MTSTPAGVDGHPRRHGHLLDRPRPGRSQFVLHLHRFDDDERLARLDFVPGTDEHADDTPGHWRNDRLFAVARACRIPRRPPGSPAVDGDGDRPAFEAYQEFASPARGRDLQFPAAVGVAIKQQRKAEVTDARRVHHAGLVNAGGASRIVHRYAVSALTGSLNRDGNHPPVDLDFKRHPRKASRRAA